MKTKIVKCKNCYDKGYSTTMYGYSGADEFNGREVGEAPRVHIHFCNCAKGKRMNRELPKELKKYL